MLTSKEEQVFETVARNYPQLTEILQKLLVEQTGILIKVVDVGILQRTQGHAQCLHKLIGHLEQYKSPRKGTPT